MGGDGGSEASRKGDEIRLPRTGTILVQSVTAAAVIDLGAAMAAIGASTTFETQMPPLGTAGFANATSAPGTTTAPTPPNPGGAVGRWIDIFADGADLGYISGPTSASVSGGNAPVLATTGNAGTAGNCARLLNGTFRTYFVLPDDKFLGVVSPGTCVVRISLSSR